MVILSRSRSTPYLKITLLLLRCLNNMSKNQATGPQAEHTPGKEHLVTMSAKFKEDIKLLALKSTLERLSVENGIFPFS